MPPAYGVTQAGFAIKPLTAILGDMQAQALGYFGQDYDLSPGTPDGQMLGIVAAEAAAEWELLQICWNQFNAQDVEGAGADNIGDLRGVPREGASYTQVVCNLTISAGSAPYAAGSLVANVAGLPGLTFSNLYPVTASMISGGLANNILFQAQNIGPTSTVNPGTLTAITIPVTGWSAITNPAAQSQAGTAAELDAVYLPRQAAELALAGTCNPSSTAAAVEQAGAAQTPPQTLTITVVENTSSLQIVVGGVVLPPNTYSVVIYDGGTGWASTPAGQAAIGTAIYNNKPAGITPIGSSSYTVQDPVLGPQTVFYSLPTQLPLYVSATVVPRPGTTFYFLAQAIQSALVAAAIAPTPASGIAPAGQLVPGAPVIGSQLEAVIMATPGVFDVQALTFGFSPSPGASAPLTVPATSIATISATALGNLVITQGTYP